MYIANCEINVRHRSDVLENGLSPKKRAAEVIHRIDDLEMTDPNKLERYIVVHRIDDLESHSRAF